jgi:drug/metabolite transporter (DMT)-like permease
MGKKFFFISFLAAILFSLSTPISKILLKEISPVFLASLFYLGAAFFLLPFSYKEFKGEFLHLKQERKDVLRLLGATVFGGILGPISLLYGIRMINATTSALLLNLETVATTILAYLFFKEGLSKKVVISSIISIIAGFILVLKSGLDFSFGGILIIIACISWGLDNNFTATVEGISPKTNTIIKGFTAGTFNLFLAFFLNELDIKYTLIVIALIAGFITYGISIVLYISSARNIGATRSQIIFSSNPFLGVIISYFIFHEALDSKFFIAFILMALAIIILYYEKHTHSHIHAEKEHTHEHCHDIHHDHYHDNQEDKLKNHTHVHKHKKISHSHFHYPDIHHRHKH